MKGSKFTATTRNDFYFGQEKSMISKEESLTLDPVGNRNVLLPW